jgi:hypothetical protein
MLMGGTEIFSGIKGGVLKILDIPKGYTSRPSKAGDNGELKLRVIRQTANARQREILRYQAIKSI